MPERYDVVVIGAEPIGYVAAVGARQVGDAHYQQHEAKYPKESDDGLDKLP
jgi:pyruvate/2-oxoglutarate dehydrogenase complex dihydrolipoamide dehydrogenase (E3) component